MSGADYACGFVRYVNPGALLTFSIRDEQARVERETGKKPSVILMENHGIIVTDDDADRCAGSTTTPTKELLRCSDRQGRIFLP